RQPLASEAAVGRQDQALGWNVVEGLPNHLRHHLWGFDHGVRVADNSDGDLLRGLVRAEEGEVLTAGAGAFEGNDLGIEGQQVGESPLIGWRFPKEALLAGVAPA